MRASYPPNSRYIDPNHDRGKHMDARTPDFSAVRTAMQRYVDQEIIPGVSWAVLRGRDVVDQQCVGFADREAKTALRPDHIFRAFSNTKIFVTCAIMLLVEEGRVGLDDPIETFLPQLGKRKVLKQGATSLADIEPARSSITIRQLLTHTAGHIEHGRDRHRHAQGDPHHLVRPANVPSVKCHRVLRDEPRRSASTIKRARRPKRIRGRAQIFRGSGSDGLVR